MVHAITLFGNLQSFMRQALDQAVTTQVLWRTLSSRPRVSSRPEDGQERDSVGQGPAGWLELLAVRSVSQFPHLEAGWWLNQVVVRSLCLLILTHLLTPPGPGGSWLWGSLVSRLQQN